LENKNKNYELNINSKRLLKNFFDILKIKSISKNEKKLLLYIKKQLEKLNIEFYEDDVSNNFGGNSGNLIANYLPEISNKNPSIFLCAHLDTVFHEKIIEPIIEDGKIINKNKDEILGADDKAAVAAILEAIRYLKEKKIPTGKIYIIFTVAEEIGLFGSRYINLNDIDAKYGFVFDSDGDIGKIINKAPFHNRINLKVIGKASHAGVSPEKGINSIKAASIAISKINLGRLDDETTCNIGIIKGGVETNIIPEITEVFAEARSINVNKLNNVTQEIINEFEKACSSIGAKLEYNILREYDGYEIDKDNTIIKIAVNALKKLKINPIIASTGGGSDTNNFNSKGKIAINLSCGVENCHSKDEFIKISELEKLVKLIIEICRGNEKEEI
jgi:tripeptide aminopeptidase